MTAHLDYIRLASWAGTAYPLTTSKILEAWPGGWEKGKWQQYAGWRKAGFFIGHGEQDGRRHHVMHVSGNLAHRMQNGMAKQRDWYGTRIDIQVTIPKPRAISLPRLQKQLGKKIATLISSEDNDSLYLGQRTSELFTRLYEKPLDQLYLRLEFELKSTRARACWDAIIVGESPSSIFKYYLIKSKLPDRVKKYFDDADIESTKLAMDAEIRADDAKTLAWINSLDKCMRRHMNSHTIGDQVREIIRSWAFHSATVDKDEPLN
jgi:hypothetical protein